MSLITKELKSENCDLINNAKNFIWEHLEEHEKKLVIYIIKF